VSKVDFLCKAAVLPIDSWNERMLDGFPPEKFQVTDESLDEAILWIW
jgi:hypothetical protein